MANQEDNTKRMTVRIAGRSYPVKATAQEALKIPSIEKKIKDQIMQLQVSYKNLDIQDCISMVLLTNMMSDPVDNDDTTDQAIEKIDAINTQLASIL